MLADERRLAAIERIKDLIPLQKKLSFALPEDVYNVFVFGSYPTVRYEKGISDVDIAVYADDIDIYMRISVIIEEFFEEKGIPLDLFFIDVRNPAPIYLAPLHSQIQFTDYYPEELIRFEQECETMLSQIKRGMAV
ncbi:MAG: nucleotidyltransferase domain-containing protein [Oribacterium sp.]|nr:nucleotidyltransferase domain-containing protein [Oribacterium sp.]MBR1855985.1 nucleotidyltransferase domain-containing protein [Oribacterium sp.]